MKNMKTNIPKAISGIVLVALLTFTFGANVITTFASVSTPTDAVISTNPDYVPYVPIATNVDATQETTTSAIISMNTMKSGDVFSAGIEPGAKVTADVWTKAMEKDVDVKLLSISGAHTTWNFAGINTAVDFDPSVYVGTVSSDVNYAAYKANLAEDAYVPVTFAFHGTLPGTAEVIIDLPTDKFTKGQTVYLYYYNPETGKFEFVDDSVYYGYVSFTMTHCSEYIVTGAQLTENVATTVKASPKTGEVANVALYSLIGIAAIAFVFTSKKK